MASEPLTKGRITEVVQLIQKVLSNNPTLLRPHSYTRDSLFREWKVSPSEGDTLVDEQVKEVGLHTNPIIVPSTKYIC